jgi:hypothetical protein
MHATPHTHLILFSLIILREECKQWTCLMCKPPRSSSVQMLHSEYSLPLFLSTQHSKFHTHTKQQLQLYILIFVRKVKSNILNWIVACSSSLSQLYLFHSTQLHYYPLYFISLYPENGGSVVLQDVSIPPQHDMTSQPRRPRLEASLPWKPCISHSLSPYTFSYRA